MKYKVNILFFIENKNTYTIKIEYNHILFEKY